MTPSDEPTDAEIVEIEKRHDRCNTIGSTWYQERVQAELEIANKDRATLLKKLKARRKVTREMLANIIDPSAWTSRPQAECKLDAFHESLRKADAILKMVNGD